jgi:hypothetical protein
VAPNHLENKWQLALESMALAESVVTTFELNWQKAQISKSLP